MAAITTRSGKGSALTTAEVDANFTNLNTDKAEKAITISAGTGLSGGGDLSANRTISLANTAVSAGTFGGNNSIPTFTVDAQGRLTAASAVTPSGTWGISVSGNANTATTLATARGINGVSFNGGGDITISRVRAIDDRALAPGDVATNYVTAAFTSWNNNSTSPYADALVFRTYSDSSGGSDNMLSLRKDALGLRVWQQTYGSATAFATYKDVAWTDGTNASGTWSISTTGSAATLTTGRTIGMTGDVTWTSGSFNGSANVTGTATLANSGVTAGTYNNVATEVRPFTVDAKGRVTAIGTAVTVTPAWSSITGKPTTLSGYGITDAQPLDADLTAIAALAGTSGFLKKTAADTWALDTNTYLTGNQTITLSGDATGSGTTSIAVTLANSGVTAGSYGGNNSIPSVTVDAKGRVTAASTVTPSGTWGISVSGSAATLTTGRTIGMTGDVTWTSASFNGSANVTGTATLANSGVTAGTYTKITVDAKGRATSGTTLSASDIPDLTLEKVPDAWVKRAVRAATTANITLSGTQTIDGIALVAGDRVLVKDQTTASQNGIYVVSATTWARAADADTIAELAGACVSVDSGTANGGFRFDTDLKTTDTLGTTAVSWYRVLDTLDVATANTANKIVQRDASGDINVRYANTQYVNMSHAAAARTTDTVFYSSNDAYIRKNTAAGFRQSLDVPTRTGGDASGTWGISITGNSATATTLQTARTLWGQSFNGSANVTGELSSVTTLSMSGQLTNTVAVGTAPFVITSTTRVANLNVATAGTADTLTTARTINGTSFNGSANITTANWGTARTLTIGSTGKSVNGSADVSWSLTEIGAPSTTGTGASGTWGINISGNAASSSVVGTNTGAASNSLQYWQLQGNTTLNPDSGWHYGIRMSHGDADTYYSATIVIPFGSDVIKFKRKEGGVDGSWRTVLSDNNYNSYAPTLTGGNASGTWGISITGDCTGTSKLLGYSASGQGISVGGQGGPQVSSQGGGAAMMSFHRPGNYAINFGLGTDNQLRTGGWSRGGDYVILDSGNYSVYSNFGGNAVYGAIYYDANHTGYYCDPAYVSNLAHLYVASTLYLTGSGAAIGNSTGARLYESYGPVWNLSNNATWHYQVINGSILCGFMAGGTNWGGGNIVASGSMRSQIFYDHNDTSWYCDPNGTSRLQYIQSFDFANISDDRLKSRDGLITNALEKVCGLTAFYYTPSAEGKVYGLPEQRAVGLSANEMLVNLPEIVNDDGSYLTMDYSKVTALLVAAQQEARREYQSQIDDLKAQIAELKSLIMGA